MTFKYDEVLCPICNGPMISRKSVHGVFWGCKKFPNCNGTRDSQGRSKADRMKEKGEEVEDTREGLTVDRDSGRQNISFRKN
jgi:ssDNA-binding Zn-finger/Zn-ribbon topoisomerase 1